MTNLGVIARKIGWSNALKTKINKAAIIISLPGILLVLKVAMGGVQAGQMPVLVPNKDLYIAAIFFVLSLMLGVAALIADAWES